MESKRKYGSRGPVRWALILPVVCMMFTAGGCGMNDMYTRDWEQWSEEAERTVVVLEPEELTASDEENMTDTEENSAPESSVREEDSGIAITISAAGDVTLGNAHTQEYAYSFRQMYDSVEDKGYFFENVLPYFEQDDMTIVNLEGALTYSEETREGNTYSIKGDPEYARILTLGSVEAVGMANNHRRDYLEQGSKDTVAALEQENIVWAYDGNVGIYETKGVKIGIIAVNWVAYGKGIMKFVEKGLQQLEEQGADLKIVACHWGIEREYLPNEDQRELGRQCIDLGADMVLGHHPHVLQGIERYKDRYIVYSMGNFCFGANRNPADKDTMIFQQTFVLEEGRDVRYGEARIIPCSVSSISKRNDFRPTPAQGEEYTRILRKINDLSAYFGVAADEEGRLTEVPAVPFPESVESE
ncbi:MAG: CapA family protein [Lachnospiraceae bacterium]|nr:CapA family protein [Lachnospiraceae bacterium]